MDVTLTKFNNFYAWRKSVLYFFTRKKLMMNPNTFRHKRIFAIYCIPTYLYYCKYFCIIAKYVSNFEYYEYKRYPIICKSIIRVSSISSILIILH